MKSIFSSAAGLETIQKCTQQLRSKQRISGMRSRIVAENGYQTLNENQKEKFRLDFNRLVGPYHCLICGEDFTLRDLEHSVSHFDCLKCSFESASEKISMLEIKLGENRDWKHAIGWKAKYSAFSKVDEVRLGRLLSKMSEEMGVDKKSGEHQKFGNVGVYHISVARALAENLLKKRK